jgi:hypothetical protein
VVAPPNWCWHAIMKRRYNSFSLFFLTEKKIEVDKIVPIEEWKKLGFYAAQGF